MSLRASGRPKIDIGGYVGSVAMQVEQGSRLRVLRWNPPTGELIAFERKSDVVELQAQVAGRDIHDPTRMEEDLRLRVPDHPYHQEVHLAIATNNPRARRNAKDRALFAGGI